MKCDRCYHLDMYFGKNGVLIHRCLRGNVVNRSGCDEFMEDE